MSDPCKIAFAEWEATQIPVKELYSIGWKAWQAAWNASRANLPTVEELVDLLCDFEADDNADHGPTFQLADAILSRIKGETK